MLQSSAPDSIRQRGENYFAGLFLLIICLLLKRESSEDAGGSFLLSGYTPLRNTLHGSSNLASAF